VALFLLNGDASVAGHLILIFHTHHLTIYVKITLKSPYLFTFLQDCIIYLSSIIFSE
jgi:hypothetical protein